jgi:hypothetical protein
MARGRCAGCGMTNASIKKMRAHIMSCPDYTELFQRAPERALEPVQEQERWLAAEGSAEARDAARDERLEALRERLAAARVAQVDRWRTPDDLLS